MKQELPSPPATGALLTQQRAEGAEMVAAWRSSGLSMRAYAKQAGLSERRLGLWKRRLEPADTVATHASSDPSASAFVPVSVSASNHGLEVVIDERVIVRVAPDCDLGLHCIGAIN